MKKKILLLLICLCLVGCGKKEKNKEETNVTGGWETVFSSQKINIDEEKENIFRNAKENYDSLELEPIALLGEQVVAGKNYMFLAKGYQIGEGNKATYKIVVIYNDLENKSSITKVVDFDYTKYTNENIEGKDESLSGGWIVNSPEETKLDDDKVQSIFDNSTSTLTGMSFKPITVLGTQIVSGTNYAVLCYGRASYENTKEGIYLLTLYEDLNGTQEIVSIAHIDLADFNK